MQSINALPTQAPMQANTIELKDIHVPEQISNFPIAYGWWLLAAMIVFIAIITIIKMRKNAQRNQVKKQALIQLKNTPNLSINDTVALLKWAAMHYFSRTELAKLFGDSLQSFLTAQLPIKYQEKFTSLSKEAFINQYQSQKDEHNVPSSDSDFYHAAILWLTHALPPKPSKKIETNTDENMSSPLKKSQGVSA
ncbi:DUF4381 domain-containing protein [Colwellia sp. 4_MG-2023]|uniref:DUF4381 domain-containing protein n=1 Tax=unclassified Colwellia TaxID=196834 RepID=UPI0026E2E385|nr:MULTISPECIES: DUF4381 domain-containing protein [unclassified Colwellia]MDO6505578.1 DUF4381 domain-containing protein [Colwellia sp. 5_MG-2023]MDO6554126.1 DUF4381 domain-containing protein [Colwellia sp. 4_MG-2023]